MAVNWLAKTETKPITVWHAYVVRAYGEYPYNVHTMVDEDVTLLLRQYLHAAFGDDEWSKIKVLDLIRDVKRSQVRTLAIKHFPSIFRKKRPACPLLIPEEIEDFDESLIEQAKEFRTNFRELKASKREVEMNDATVVSADLDGVMIVVTRVDNGKKIDVKVNAGQLTLDNFHELTGRRFRMTKDQVQRLGDPKLNPSVRQEAFNEFMTAAISNVRREQGGVTDERS